MPVQIVVGADKVWTGGSAVIWSTVGNWTGGVPGAGDTAVFSSASPVNQPTVTASTSIAGLTFTVNPPITINSSQLLTVTAAAGTTGAAGVTLLGAGGLSFTATGSNLGFGSGPITLNGGGLQLTGSEVSINTTTGLPTSGGGADRTLMNDFLVTANGGRLVMNTGSGANGAATAFNTLALGGGLTLTSGGGGNAEGYTIAGTVTLQQDISRTLRIAQATSHNGSDWIAGKITDGAGGAGNALRIQVTGRTLQIANGANDYAGGTLVETGSGNNILDVMSGGTLGAGSLTVQSGGRIRLKNPTASGSPGNLAAAATITADAGSAVGVGANVNIADRFTASSAGVYGIDVTTHSYALNMSTMGSGGMFLGSMSGGTYSGTSLTAGSGSTYRLGGGSPSAALASLTLSGVNALTGNNNVQVGAGLNSNASYGRVVLTASQDFTGTVTVETDGLLASRIGSGTPWGNTANPINIYGVLALCGVAGASGGVLNPAYASGLTLKPGGFLLLDYQDTFGNATAQDNTDRWPDATAVTLRGATLQMQGNRNVDSSETFGALTVGDNAQLMTRRNGTQAKDVGITLASITREARGVLRVNVGAAANLGGDTADSTERFVFASTNGLAISNGMVAPWAADVIGYNFLQYKTASGVNVPGPLGLAPVTYSANTLNTPPAATDIISVGAAIQLNNNPTCHALKIAGNFAVTTTAGNTVTIGSGGLVDQGNATHTAAFDFGSNEAIIWKFVGTAAYNGGIKTTGGFIKAGGNTINLAGSPTISGGVTVQQGLLTINSANAASDLSDNLLTVNQDGLFNMFNYDVTVLGLAGVGRGGNVYNNGAGVKTLTLNLASGVQTYEGRLQASGTAANLNIAKTGTGKQVLSGTNSYTGTTTIDGTLQFAKRASLYGSVTANWTATSLIVNSGGTLALNVGGAGEFTANDIDTLKALGTGSGGFKSGAMFGLDTSNAGGSFAYNSAIDDPNSGANVLGVTKLGNGTLTLGGASTYKGKTTVLGGTLAISAENNLGGNPSTFTADQLALNGGALQTTASFMLRDANRGVTLSSGVSTITVANATTFTVSNVVAGAGGLATAGPGTLELAAANTYSGATFVATGTLLIGPGGSIGASTVTVSSVATLGNNATNVAAIGADTTLDAGALATFKADGSAAALGKISVTGNLTLDANGVTVAVSGAALPPGTYRLFECTGTLANTGTFATPTLTGSGAAGGVSIGVTTGVGGHVDLVVSSSSTPTTTTLTRTVGSESQVYGTPLTFHAVVTGATIPNGDIITFKSGATIIGASAISGGDGHADLTLSNLAAGASQTIAAEYSGNIGQSLAASTGTLAGAQTITALPVTLSGSRTYDASTAASAAILTVGNAIGTDSVTVASGTATLASNAIGSRAIVDAGTLTLGGTAAGNYTVVGASGAVSIAPKGVTITGVTANAKTYDGGAVATLTGGDVSGAYGGDDVSVSAGSGTFGDVVVGSQSVTASGFSLAGGDAGNYTLSAQPTVPNASIAPRPVSLGGSRGYDGTTSVEASALTVTNKVGADVVTVASGTATVAARNVGVEAIMDASGLTLGGASSANYTVGGASGAVTISAKSIIITNVTADSRIYNGTNTATLSGSPALLAAESPASGTTSDGLPYTGDTVGVGGTGVATFEDRHAGNGKTVTVTGYTLTGADAGNYAPTQPSLTATITSKALTVSGVTANNKPWDGTTNATLSGTATLPAAEAPGTGTPSDGKPYTGDTITTGQTASAYFADPDVGTAKAVTVTGYTIGGANGGNYTATQPTGLTANITPPLVQWNGNNSSTWSDGGNWVGGVAPADDTVTALARFNSTFTNQPDAGTRSIAGLQLGSSLGTNLLISGSQLTIGTYGIDASASPRAALIAANVVLGANQTWTLANAVTNGGTLSGAYALTKSGAGTLTYANATAPAHGDTILSAGRINYNNAAASGTFAFGSGAIGIDSGARFHFNATAGSLTLGNPFAIGSGGGTVSTPAPGTTIGFAGNLGLAGHLTFGQVDGGGGGGPGGNYSGTITIDQGSAGTRRITISSGGNHGPTISGNIVDGAGATGNGLILRTVDSGNGRDVTLSGNNSYAGDTVIQGVANGAAVGRYVNAMPAMANAYALGQGNITVESGALLRLGTNAVLGAGKTIMITQSGNDATGVGIGRNVDPATWINPASTGTIMIGIDASNSTASIDLGSIVTGGNAILCSMVGQTGLFGGTIAAGTGSTYRFGAGGSGQGAGGNLILTGANALTGNNGVQVGGWYGNTTPIGHGTLTLANSNNVVGTLTVAAGNGGNSAGSTLAGRGSGAFGSGNTIVLSSSSANAPTLRFETNAQIHDNTVSITGTNMANVTANAVTVLNGAITQTDASTLNLNGLSILALSGGANTGVSGKTTLASGLLSLTNGNQIGGGHLNVAGGALVFNTTTWASFAAGRSGGYATSGDGTWQLSGGGLAARGAAVTVDAAATTAGVGGTFDRSFTLGSTVLGADGLPYANAAVILDRGAGVDTITLSGAADRTITVAGGATLASSAYSVAGPIHEIAGTIAGGAAGRKLTIQGTATTANGGLPVLRLSSTNNSFLATVETPSGSPAGYGVLVATDDRVFGDAANVVRVLGSTPGTSIAGNTGWLLLFEGDKTFARSLVFSVANNDNTSAPWGIGAYSGVVVYAGAVVVSNTSATVATTPLSWHVENGGQLTLGVSGGTAATFNNNMATANRPIRYRKTGPGVAILGNVTYGGTSSGSYGFIIQNGALRETGNTAANSVSGGNVAFSGGVLETCDATMGAGFTRALGTGATQVQWTTGGGGFAAYGGALTVNVGSGIKLTWGGASFIPASSPLILGSTTANGVVTVMNELGLNSGTREVRVIDNPGSTADRAVLAGELDGNGSALVKTGDGVLEIAVASTKMLGNVIASNGTLLVNGVIPASAGTVTIASGATLGGTGAVNHAVSVSAGGRLAPGDAGPGTLTVSNLTLAAGSTTVFELGTASDRVVVNGNVVLAGTIDLSAGPGYASGVYTVLTYTGTSSGAGLSVGTMPDGSVASVTNDTLAGQVRVVVEAYEAPQVSNDVGATNITAVAALLRGEVSVGLPAPAVYVCWGASDPGTDSTGAWEHVESLGACSGAFGTDVVLAADTVYFYRCFATNAVGSGWGTAAAVFDTGRLTVTATVANAAEAGPVNGAFRIERPANCTNRAVAVRLATSGTATQGADYTLVTNGTAVGGGAVVLPAGAASLTVTVAVNADPPDAGDPETVVLELEATGLYAVGADTNATVFIADSTSGQAPAVNNNGGASGVTVGSAGLNGQVTAGTPGPQVWVCWGAVLPGSPQNTGNWEHVESLGPQGGSFSTNITGLASDTEYYYTCLASNASGGAWSPVTNFHTFLAPAVNNGGGASEVATNGASLNGQVTAGYPTPTVYVCWGSSDPGVDSTGAWDHVETFPGPQSGAFVTTVTGLTPNADYYYRCYAASAAGSAWAGGVETFHTLEAPAVDATGASAVAPESATLNGLVTAGFPTPQVWVCWGTNNAGTSGTGVWEHVEAMGVQAGAFAANLAGLSRGVSHFYACFATNVAGVAWSTVASFTTPADFTLFWDGNGGTAGAGNTAALLNKTWGSDAAWNSDATGGGAGSLQVATTTNDAVHFVAGPASDSGAIAFTSTVSGAQSAKGLNFQASGPVTVSGGTSLTLGTGVAGAGGISVAQYAYGTTSNAAHTIATPLVLANDQVWSNAAANTLTVSGGVSGGYQLTKAGFGTLGVTQSGSLGHGATVVAAGRVNYNNAAASGGFWFGTGAVSLDNGARFHFNASAASLTLSNAFAVGASGGTVSTVSGTSRAYTFAGPLSLGGHWTFGQVDGGGGGGPGGIYSGTVTIDQDGVGPRRITLSSGGNHGPTISGDIVDGAGAAGNGLAVKTVETQNGRDVALSGNNSYAGDTTIQGPASGSAAGRYINATPTAANAYALGQGNITVESGAMLRLGTNAVLGAGRTITAIQTGNDATTVGIARNVDPATWIDPASSGTIAIGIDGSNSTANINLATLTADGNGILGSTVGQSGIFGGTLTAGAGNLYRFGAGGGAQGSGGGLLLTGSNALSGNNAVQVGGWYGNTTTYGHGVLTLASANNLVGTLTVAAGNGTTGAGSVLASRISGAFGAGNTVVLASSAANGPTVRFETVAQTHDNPITITGTGTANLTANAFTVLNGALTQTNASTLNVNGTAVLVLGAPADAANGKTTVAGGALALAAANGIGDGNLNLSGGVLVLDGLAWADFAADRSGGYATSGANTWQLSGGGLAARGMAVTVDAAATTAGAGGTFDRALSLGSTLLGSNGVFHADAAVILNRGAGVDTITFSADRTFTLAGGATQSSGVYTLAGPVYEIAGRISSSAGGTARTLTLNGSGAATGIPMFRLSNTGNTDLNLATASGAAVGWGVVIASDDAALPGTVTINSSSPGGAGSGWLLLFEGSKTFDKTVTLAFGGSSAAPTHGLGAYSGAVVYRGTLAMDGTGANSAYVQLQAETGASLTLGEAGDSADFITTRTGQGGSVANVYRKVGGGVVVLQNVNHVDGAASHAFEVSAGALREAGNSAADSASGANLALSGGVLETCDAVLGGVFARVLGAGAGQVRWAAGGGGFAAYGGPLTVNAGSGTKLTWGSANFIPGGSPLILGSTTANGVVTVLNELGLNSGTREVRVIDNPATSADRAVLAGEVDVSTATALQKTGDGLLEITTASTKLLGSVAVNAGTLLVNGSIPASTGVVTVAAGATLGGTGAVAHAVAVSAGGLLAPGNAGIGTLTVSNLTLAAGATNVIEVAGGAADRIVVNGNLTLGGTLSVVNAGDWQTGAYDLMTYTGGLTLNAVTLSLSPPARATLDTSVPGKVTLLVATFNGSVFTFR